MTGATPRVERLALGPFQTNAYVVAGAAGRIVVVDPGAEPSAIEAALGGGRLEAVLLTHGHMDHVGAVAELVARHPAPVYLHPLDAAWAFAPANALLPYYAAPTPPRDPVEDLRDGQRLTFAGLPFEVIATPGHSPGGVSLYVPAHGLLFSGDTLFAGTVGRTDIPGADARALTRSLARLVTLPDATRVLPGHGEPTTIGEERRANFFLARR